MALSPGRRFFGAGLTLILVATGPCSAGPDGSHPFQEERLASVNTPAADTGNTSVDVGVTASLAPQVEPPASPVPPAEIARPEERIDLAPLKKAVAAYRTGKLEEGDGIARGPALFGSQAEPVLASIAIFDFGLRSGRAKKAGALVACGFRHERALRDQSVVEGTATDVSRGFELPVRPVHVEKQAEGFGRSIVEVLAVRLERHHAAHVDVGQLDRRAPVANPLRESFADTA